MRTNESNPSWKGDLVGYDALHNWVRRRKPKPDLCEYCLKHKKLQLANISGLYKRDVVDYVWICSICHQRAHADGRHENVRYAEHVASKKSYPETKRKYYLANADRISSEKKLRYRTDEEHRRKIIDKVKQYYQDNREHKLAYNHQYSEEHKDEIRLHGKEYRKNTRQDHIRQDALNWIRDKYKEEFAPILAELKENLPYKKAYRKAQKTLKNNHHEEFLLKLQEFRA